MVTKQPWKPDGYGSRVTPRLNIGLSSDSGIRPKVRYTIHNRPLKRASTVVGGCAYCVSQRPAQKIETVIPDI